MYLFPLHTPKVKDCFKPRFTMDKGNFGYYQQWCCCGGDHKGISCHGNCTRPWSSFQSLWSPCWHRFSALSTWACLSPPLVLQGRWRRKTTAQRWRVTAFLHFFESLGIVCRGSVRATQNPKKHTRSPTSLQSSSNILRVLRWVEELQD